MNWPGLCARKSHFKMPTATNVRWSFAFPFHSEIGKQAITEHAS